MLFDHWFPVGGHGLVTSYEKRSTNLGTEIVRISGRKYGIRNV